MPRALENPTCVWRAGARLGEGTLWSTRSQALYWVDILSNRLYRYRPADARRDHWDLGENISAVAERERETGLLVSLRRDFAFFDPDSGLVSRIARPEPEREGNRFNDGKCDAAGRFWAGTMDFDCRESTGALYCLDAGGQHTRHVDGLHITNGPTWSIDGRTMFVNETGHRRIFAFDFDPDAGRLSRRRLWLEFSEADGAPDGMTTDAEGHLWIAHFGGACVTAHAAEDGRELARIALPTDNVTNVAFGDADLRTLYITTASIELDENQRRRQPLAGGLFAVRMDVAGQPAARYAG